MKRSKPKRRVSAFEVSYPWLGMRNNVVTFTQTRREAKAVSDLIEQDPHRGQDDRTIQEVELYFPGGVRFAIAFVCADVPGGGMDGMRGSKAWRPTMPLEIPPARVLADNVAYELPDSEPFFAPRAHALQRAAAHNRETLRILATMKPAGLNWAVVVEIGQIQRSFESIELCGRLGRAETHGHFPVRLVEPTAAEVRRYGRDQAGMAARGQGQGR